MRWNVKLLTSYYNQGMHALNVFPLEFRSWNLFYGLSNNLEHFSLGGRAKFKGGFVMICHVVVWTIWKARNDVISNGVSKTVKEVEENNIFFWKWFIGKLEVNSCAYSDCAFRTLSFTLTNSKSNICRFDNGYGFVVLLVDHV